MLKTFHPLDSETSVARCESPFIEEAQLDNLSSRHYRVTRAQSTIDGQSDSVYLSYCEEPARDYEISFDHTRSS